MGRTRPDHREAIRALLAELGPRTFAQLLGHLAITDRRELDYDLRCLRTAGVITPQRGGAWTLNP